MSTPSTPLALIHDGDSIFLDVAGVSPKTVKIMRVIRYANNQNVEGVEERFSDLTLECKRACIAQVNRRYPGKTVMV